MLREVVGTTVVIAAFVLSLVGFALHANNISERAAPDLYDVARKSVVRIDADSSVGSGVVIDRRRKLILTNQHVVSGATKVTVTLFASDKKYKAKVLWTSDVGSDLALLEITDPVTLRYEAKLRRGELAVGEEVFAVGHPLGNPWVVTWGHVSTTDGLYIRTDLTILPGNSGGALFDKKGALVGMPRAIYVWSTSGYVKGATGLSIVIPARTICKLTVC